MLGGEVVSRRYGERAGEMIGSLTFVGLASERGDNNRLLGTFRCVCGKTVTLAAGRVLNGKVRSHCGCQTDHGAHSRVHGMRYSREYASWQAMKARCLDPGNKDYPRWGGRGITIAPTWIESFEAFFAHMGPRPKGTTIDRINNSKGYEPGNCRWATAKQQQNNRRTNWEVTIDGATFLSVKEAADHFSVSETTIVRWCDGFVDQRRTHQADAGYTPPRPNCSRKRRYADI